MQVTFILKATAAYWANLQWWLALIEWHGIVEIIIILN